MNAGYGWATGTVDIVGSGSVLGTFATSDTRNLTGAVGGGQFGGNYQIGMIVLGFELDEQWSGQKNVTVSSCGFGCALNDTVQINVLLTARARLGAAIDRIFMYATGGAAWMHIKDTLTAAVQGLTIDLGSPSGYRVGWTAGAGLEAAIGSGLSVKIEFLYIATNQLLAPGLIPPAVGGGTISETATLRDKIFRIGMNYRLSR